MSRDEFWRLHPTEFWWVAQARYPVKMYGKMTEHEVEHIYRRAYPNG